jgi:ankyrin repeat protein
MIGTRGGISRTTSNQQLQHSQQPQQQMQQMQQQVTPQARLFEACSTGKLATVSEIIDSGVDVNVTDANGNTPLHIAALAAGMHSLHLILWI